MPLSNRYFFGDIEKINIFAAQSKGEMAEWSIAAVLKTVELRGSGGSNPSLSANKTTAQPVRAKQKRKNRPSKLEGGLFFLLSLPLGRRAVVLF